MMVHAQRSAEVPNVTGVEDDLHQSLVNAPAGQLLTQRDTRPKHTRLNRTHRQIKRLGNLFIRALLNECKRRDHLKLRWQLAERELNGFRELGIAASWRSTLPSTLIA